MSIRKRYVAFIDILGFKSIMDNINDSFTLGDQLAHIFQASILSSLTGTDIEVIDNPNLNVHSEIKVYQFSDTIIIYTETDDERILKELITSLNLLIAQAAIRGFLLRGALTKGDLYVNGSIIVGNPLVEAYTLEARQEWAGLIVHCDISCDLLRELLDEKLLTYEFVTLKDTQDKKKLVSENHLVINWPQYCGWKVTSKDDFMDSITTFTGMPSKQNDIEKINRTFEFFMKNLGGKKLPNFRFGVGRVVFNDQGKALFIQDQM